MRTMALFPSFKLVATVTVLQERCSSDISGKARASFAIKLVLVLIFAKQLRGPAERAQDEAAGRRARCGGEHSEAASY